MNNNTQEDKKYVLIITGEGWYSELKGHLKLIGIDDKDQYQVPVEGRNYYLTVSKEHAIFVTLHYADGGALALSDRKYDIGDAIFFDGIIGKSYSDENGHGIMYDGNLIYLKRKSLASKIEATNDPKLIADGVMELKGTIPTQEEKIKAAIEKLLGTDTGVKFNGLPCKNGCNCVEVAEYNNGGEGIKSYPCLNTSLRNATDKVSVKEENKSINEAAEDTQRPNGYYWVKYQGKDVVGHFTHIYMGEELNEWYLAGYEGVFKDTDFDGIGAFIPSPAG